jgi:hypothetical protein
MTGARRDRPGHRDGGPVTVTPREHRGRARRRRVTAGSAPRRVRAPVTGRERVRYPCRGNRLRIVNRSPQWLLPAVLAALILAVIIGTLLS